MKTAVFAGTFDPVTLGHLDIVGRAARLFDRLTVAVAADTGKRALFTAEERAELIREEVKNFPNVEVRIFSGLLCDFVKKEGISVLVRGIRNPADFSYEFQMAGVNRLLLPEADTVYLQTDPAYQFVASSYVKEVAKLGGPDLSKFISPAVEKALIAKLA